VLLNRCVLDRTGKVAFHWGKAGDVTKIARKFVNDPDAVTERSVAINVIVDAMTVEELKEQLSILKGDMVTNTDEMVDLKREILDALLVEKKEKNAAVEKYVHWSKTTFQVLNDFYADAIKLKDKTFRKTGQDSFHKVIVRIMNNSGNEYYSDQAKHFEKWIAANHFQMLRQADIQFLISSANVLAESSASSRKVLQAAVQVLQNIQKQHELVADYNDKNMMWVVRPGTPLTTATSAAKRGVVTPDKMPTKRARTEDEINIGGFLLTENIDREGKSETYETEGCLVNERKDKWGQKNEFGNTNAVEKGTNVKYYACIIFCDKFLTQLTNIAEDTVREFVEDLDKQEQGKSCEKLYPHKIWHLLSYKKKSVWTMKPFRKVNNPGTDEWITVAQNETHTLLVVRPYNCHDKINYY